MRSPSSLRSRCCHLSLADERSVNETIVVAALVEVRRHVPFPEQFPANLPRSLFNRQPAQQQRFENYIEVINEKRNARDSVSDMKMADGLFFPSVVMVTGVVYKCPQMPRRVREL